MCSFLKYYLFIKGDAEKQTFLGNAAALVVPSLFDEPFGMVSIEALACGTPVIGLDSGATPEIIKNGENGLIVKKADELTMVANLALAMRDAGKLSRAAARTSFETQFTFERMCAEHFALYERCSSSIMSK